MLSVLSHPLLLGQHGPPGVLLGSCILSICYPRVTFSGSGFLEACLSGPLLPPPPLRGGAPVVVGRRAQRSPQVGALRPRCPCRRGGNWAGFLPGEARSRSLVGRETGKQWGGVGDSGWERWPDAGRCVQRRAAGEGPPCPRASGRPSRAVGGRAPCSAFPRGSLVPLRLSPWPTEEESLGSRCRAEGGPPHVDTQTSRGQPQVRP